MPRFQATIDIWELTDEQRRALPVGQWVRAGKDGPLGRFFGQGTTTVVAWVGNARASRDYRSYMQTIRDYGRGVMRAAARNAN